MDHREEIELSKVFSNLNDLIKEIKKKRILILILCGLGALGGYFSPSNPLFHSKATVSLNTGGQRVGLLNIANSLGFNDGQEVISFEKYEAIVTSNKLFNELLFDEVKVDNKSDLLIYHIISILKLDEIWKKRRPHLLNVDLAKESPTKDTILSIVIPILENALSLNEGKGDIVEINCDFKNEDICLKVPSLLAQKGIDFFYDKTLRKDLHTQYVLKTRLDSTIKALDIAELNYTSLKDKSHRTVKMSSKLALLKSQREVALLNELYLQIYKQYEMISFKVNSTQIGLELIDTPRKPLLFTQNSLIKKLTLGFIVGLIISVGVILIQMSVKTVQSRL